MITAIGGMLLPICLWYWRSPSRLLQLVFVYAVFAAAAIIVIGGNGVLPALLPAALFIGLFLLAALNGTHYPAERPALAVLAPFILVVCGALVSSIIMPRLFEGDVLVWPQKISVFLVMSPLAPNAGNYTQDMYLLLDAGLTVTASLYLTRDGAGLRQLLNYYFASGLLAVLISLWQFTANTLHIWFPTSFFLNNPGWTLLSNETVGSLIRLSGPFSEPSSLGAYLSAIVCASGWIIFNGDRALLPRLAFWSSLIVVLLCTATTGYATLAVMAMVLVVRTFLTASATLRRRVFAGLFALGLAGTVAAVAVPMVAPGIARQAVVVFNGTLNKQQSASYESRTTADRDSLREMVQTYGLGVGWGSNRSSSLGPGLFAEIGLWGVLGLLWFGVSLALYARGSLRLTQSDAYKSVIRACGAALLSSLVSALLSGPTISSPDFYLLLAMLVSVSARVRHEAAPRLRIKTQLARPATVAQGFPQR